MPYVSNPQAKLTSKNQMTVPKAVRERLGASCGDRLEFEPYDENSYIVRRRASVHASEIAGILGPPPNGRSLTIEEMDEAVGEAVAKRYARSVSRR